MFGMLTLYRIFKDWVYNTNFQKVSQTLLEMECRRQTITFILNGAFELLHPELTAVFRSVAKKCPTLLQHLTATNPEVEELEDKVDTQAIECDAAHLDAEAQIALKPKGQLVLQDSLLGVRHCHKLDNNHPFVARLLDAYENDYNMPHVTTLQRSPIQWVKKLKFLHP
jgi:hypothetical protein